MWAQAMGPSTLATYDSVGEPDAAPRDVERKGAARCAVRGRPGPHPDGDRTSGPHTRTITDRKELETQLLEVTAMATA